MRRRLLSQVLATLLGGASPLLSMCGAGAEINGFKFSPTGIRIDQINVGGGGAPGFDPAAGEKGRTEYEGKPMGTCRFIERDGVRKDVVCE